MVNRNLFLFLEHRTLNPKATQILVTIMSLKMLQALLVIVTLELIASNVYANSSLLDQANLLMANGRKTEASLVFRKILLTYPHNIEANIGLATIQSWDGKYQQAEHRYLKVLEQQPNHLRALVGLGYTLGWSGQYDKAAKIFSRARVVAPDSFDVDKGAAFIALWRKDSQRAASEFRQLVTKNPGNTELLVALGHAQLMNSNSAQAIDAFQSALAIEPENKAAKNGLRAAYTIPSILEIGILYGNNEEDTGLRQFEIGSWITNNSRVWLRYDDSLSLDAPDLTRGDAETLLLGAFHRFNSVWTGRIEVGGRDLPDSKKQDIYSLEITNLQRQKIYKLGLQRSPHSDDYTDSLVYGGVGLPVSAAWYYEPMLYLSETGPSGDDNWRLLNRFTYQSSELWGMDLSIGFGEEESALPEFDGSITTASISWYMPVSQNYRISLLILNEDTPSEQRTSVILGFVLRIPRG